MYRTKYTDPDYRKQPKTNKFCAICQKDIKNEKTTRWIAIELDKPMQAIHPDDLPSAWKEIRPRRAAHHHNTCIVFEMVGSECARRLGKEWSMEKPGEIPG